MNYLYSGEQYRLGKEYKVLDVSNMGPNAQYYLFKYANYYELPFYFFNFNFAFVLDKKEKTGNPILDYPAMDMKFSLNEEQVLDYWDFYEVYDKTTEELENKYNEIAFKAREKRGFLPWDLV